MYLVPLGIKNQR